MSQQATLSSEQIRTVLEVSRLLTITTDLDRLFTRIAEATCDILSCERASIFLHDPAKDELWTMVALLANREIRIPAGAGVAGWSFRNNQLVHVTDPYQDPRFNPEPDRRSGFRTRNLLTSPVVDIEHKPIGVLQAVNKKDGDFASIDIAMIGLLADQAGVAFQRHRLQAQALEAVSHKREMMLAKSVQEALIPKSPPPIQGWDCCGWTHACDMTGGDCFDLWRTQDGRLAVLVADASGHGLAPAIIVSQARTLIRVISELEDDPLQLLKHVNARLAGDLEPSRFVTAFLAFLSSDGWLHWASAGHAPVLLRDRAGEALRSLEPNAAPLAAFADFDGEDVPRQRVGQGGLLAVISDGMTDARSPSGEEFGLERLLRILNDHADASPQTQAAAMREGVRGWQGNDSPIDDQSVVLALRTE